MIQSISAGQGEYRVLPVFDQLANDAVWMREVTASDGAHPGAPAYARLAALVDAWPIWWFR